MGADSDVQTIKKELESDTRDVADLWTDALKKYKGIVGEDLQPKFTSVDAMIQFGTNEMNNFHKFRHDQKKVDKLRSLFMSNLSYIEKGSQQLIAAATPAFPPAAAIGTALTYMLSACKQVSADYDVVTAFFEDMNAFLQRITILESRLPKYRAYRNCLIETFISFLTMTGIATKYIELGRFKKWILNMVRGEDGDLGGARKNMDVTLSRLQSATEYAILGNTEELQRMNSDLQENQDMQTRMMEDQTKMLETVIQSQDSVRADLKNIQQLLIMFDDRRREDPSRQKASKATTQNKKPPTSNQVRSYFEETLNPFQEYQTIKESFIADTGTWIFDEPKWKTWLDQEQGSDAPRILSLIGKAGAGKSHLAANIYDQLANLAEKDVSKTTCVAYFYFREWTKDLNEFYKSINWAVQQVSEQNATLCEKICAEIQRDDAEIDVWEWKSVFTKLLKPCFDTSSKFRLRIVLDGLDELSESERTDLFEFFALLKDSNDSSITIICTTREILRTQLTSVGAQFVEVTKEKLLPDLKALVWHHLNNDGGLRKFSKYMKQRISSTLEEKADGMLYAEHLLRQFNILGREPLVLKALDHMPGSLQDLYLNMLADLHHHTPDEELEAMKVLLCWLSHSYRPLSLAECLSILEISSHSSFDLERELQGRPLARFIRMGEAEERVKDNTAKDVKLTIESQNNPDAPFYDRDLPLKFQERSMSGFFGGAEQDLRTLRKNGNREMFIVCSDILCGRVPSAHEGLRKYAAQFGILHLSWTAIGEYTENDRIRTLNALGNLMGNDHNAATVIETLGVDYEEINDDFDSGILMKDMAYWASQAVLLRGKVNAITSQWADKVSADTHTAFESLARGHVSNWLQAQDLKSALRSFKFARSAIKMKDQVEVIDTKATDSDEEETDDDDDDEEESNYTRKEIVAAFDVYDDVPKDANAYWSLALLLEHCGHHKSALPHAFRALKMCKDPVKKFQISDLLANILLARKETEKANDTICKALSEHQSLPANLRRAGLITRAKIEVSSKRFNDAVTSYEEARLANLDEPLSGDTLKDTFNACVEKADDAILIEVVKNWSATERLTWMTWQYDDVGYFDHEKLRRAAARAGQQAYLYQAYDEVIKLLDNLDAAPPIRFELALTHWRLTGDITTAKALMNETLDTSSSGYPYAFTDEDPAYELLCAVMLMSQVIYEEYRSTSEPSIKAQLYTEIKGLTKRPFAQSIAAMKSELMHHSLTIARMSRKMATAQEFHEILNEAFNTCWDALIDSVGWNDSENLSELACVISSLGGLEKEAQILVSARFSELDPSNDDDDDDEEEEGGSKKGGSDDEDDDDEEEEEEDDEGDDYPLPTNEGDLSDESLQCDGECNPGRVWRAWKDRPMYVCTMCWDVALCEDCHAKRQEYNKTGGDAACRAAVGASYCGTNHRYVRGPVPGWKGIKDGVMTIEGQNGEEPIHVKFRDWLDELKTVKWKQAWERFWLTEE